MVYMGAGTNTGNARENICDNKDTDSRTNRNHHRNYIENNRAADLSYFRNIRPRENPEFFVFPLAAPVLPAIHHILHSPLRDFGCDIPDNTDRSLADEMNCSSLKAECPRWY